MVELSDQFGKPYFTKGGQGKLFSDPKPVDSVRYPRGYSPARMQEVRGMHIDLLHDSRAPNSAAFGGPAGHRRLQEVIARSETPVSEHSMGQMITRGQARPLTIMTGADLSAIAAHYGPDAVVHGMYHPRARNEGGILALSHGQSEEHAGQALLHELGHYRSAKVARTFHSDYYSNDPVSRGQEEAFADDNRTRRYRPDPRDVRAKRATPVSSPYELQSVTSPEGDEFSDAYLRARRTHFGEPLRSHLRQIFHERRVGKTEQSQFDVGG